MLMFTTIFSYQRHMSRWQGTHALPLPPPPPFGKILKSWIFSILQDFCDIYLELPLFNTTKPYER